LQVESSTKPKLKFEIESHINGKVDVVFFCNIQKVEDEETIKYKYDTFRICIENRDDIQEGIEHNYDRWLEFAKKCEYEKLAAKIRERRNELLKETDKEMCLDRLNITIPEELTATNLLVGVKQFFEGMSNIFNGKMAKYRQELRDITKQQGFPYNVVFPTNPSTEEESEEK
jgi:hypothetical protein